MAQNPYLPDGCSDTDLDDAWGDDDDYCEHGIRLIDYCEECDYEDEEAD